ncbi:LytTR family DNA-binding domain-containing protein [Compostibacter hankyongensis]|uniref:LytTR family DNA-binding domain-containing protein n=1 Tax=Compostibacter hankyongensis TaxID=1007089 RepID=A0ABP8FWA8_9BACT
MIKCYVIDDEEHAVKVLSRFIERTPELHFLGSETDPLEAWNKMENQSVAPDITFLDVDMPQISGINLAELIRTKTEIIFTTAYPDYAIQAFERDALDYLLKPVTYERFLKAISKTKDRLSLKAKNISAGQGEDYFYIKSEAKGKMIKIKHHALNYIEAKANYLRLCLDNESYLTYLTLKELEEKLPPVQFIRIHKSFIINLQKIVVLEGNKVILENGVSVDVGGSYRSKLLSAINPKLIISKRSP